jgi:hypothetical protein
MIFGARRSNFGLCPNWRPSFLPRAGGDETQLFIKEVKIAGKRYIVCRNEVVAIEEAETRRQVVAALDRQLTRGDKALIGNAAYRRFLRPVSDTQPARKRKLFEIDAGKLAEEARFDGVFVLRSNARISPLQAGLRYRDLQNGDARSVSWPLEMGPGT